MPSQSPPQTIDEILEQLDQIIFTCRQESSRLGFFATLYRNVTIKVKEGIAAGAFDDGPRMERLDVAFANRYLAALESFRRDDPLSVCWRVAFQTAGNYWPLILQHLLIGMNAHINFDLGIAAATIAPGPELPALRGDFDRINNILGGMILKVRSNVEELSPWIRFLDRLAPTTEDRIINFSLNKARASAWLVATMVSTTPPGKLPVKLSVLDDGVAMLGSLVGSPKGWLINLGLRGIRLRESNDVPHIIDVLSQM
ncbi:MAG: hypothetical protein H7Z16_05740 [Pyrinomonadaceae bacterium]|nr:hypothetical protein [Pyrinomonadaceae bacterium]